MQKMNADVVKISPLTEFVYKVELKPEHPAQFKAGQYLQIVLAEKDKRAFSIASRPSQSDLLELHIGASAEDSYAMQTLEHLRTHHENGTQASLEIGLGEAYLRETGSNPLLLLAGGTGFSYVKSMADHLAEIGSDRTVLFYWGVKSADALYAAKEMHAWAESTEHFNFIPVVEQANENWDGHTGLVHKAVMKDIASLESYDIYMAGRFNMIGPVRDDFIAHGASRENMHADAFAFIK